MDYDRMSLAELKAYAKEKNIKGVSAMHKEELCEYLKQLEKKAENTVQAEKPAAPEKQEIPEKQESENRSFIRNNSVSRPDNSGSGDREYLRRPMGDRPRYGDRPRTGEQQPANYQRRAMGTRPVDQERRVMAERPVEQERRVMAERPVEQERRVMAERPQNIERPAVPEQQVADPRNNQTDMNAVRNNAAPRYDAGSYMTPEQQAELDSGIEKNGILEIMSDGFGFIRCDNYLPGENDVYVAPNQIKRYGLRSGDIICGNTKIKTPTEKFSALLYVKSVNGYSVEETLKRKKFENLTPVFPHDRIHLETSRSSVATRMVDLIAPIGKGQRGMIVSQPKSGKTTLLKEIANSITTNHPDMNLIILLIDERPEEVTDIKESIHGEKVEVIYSTFDETPDNHKRVSEMVIDRAKRLVEYGNDVVILLDSITRLARAYNLTCISSGRTLSGGLDPAALHMPKKFFGAARTMREGGSLTILATALVETGSRMDDVVFEEFKGTGNMELVLDRNLSEKRIFPAIDLQRSGTRRDDLLLTPDEADAMNMVRRALNGAHPEDATEKLVNMCAHTRNNIEFVNTIRKNL